MIEQITNEKKRPILHSCISNNIALVTPTKQCKTLWINASAKSMHVFFLLWNRSKMAGKWWVRWLLVVSVVETHTCMCLGTSRLVLALYIPCSLMGRGQFCFAHISTPALLPLFAQPGGKINLLIKMVMPVNCREEGKGIFCSVSQAHRV